MVQGKDEQKYDSGMFLNNVSNYDLSKVPCARGALLNGIDVNSIIESCARVLNDIDIISIAEPYFWCEQASRFHYLCFPRILQENR